MLLFLDISNKVLNTHWRILSFIQKFIYRETSRVLIASLLIIITKNLISGKKITYLPIACSSLIQTLEILFRRNEAVDTA